MALTDEQKSIQCDTLASAISDNEKMAYKSNAAMNKGINPDFFTGNASKPVNIINSLYSMASGADSTAKGVYSTFSDVILDVGTVEGMAKFEEMKSATGQNTLVESITNMSRDIKELKENSESSGGGGTSSGIIINILEEPTDEEEQPETCEHEYVEGVCTKCGEAEPTNGSDGT